MDQRVQWVLSVWERYHEKNKFKIPNFLDCKIKTNFSHDLIRYYKKDETKAQNSLELKSQ